MASTRTRGVFTEQRDEFRAVIRQFLTAEVVPEYPQWVRDGRPSRRFWEGVAELGIPGIGVPEQSGGLADSDYRHSPAVTEDLHALRLQSDASYVVTYLAAFATLGVALCAVWVIGLSFAGRNKSADPESVTLLHKLKAVVGSSTPSYPSPAGDRVEV